MAGASITIDHNSQEVAAFLQRLVTHIDDLTPLMAEIGEFLVESTKQRFDDQQAPDGTPWAPLTEATQRMKKKNADKILILNEILKGDFNYDAGKQEVSVGTGKEYAAIHQFGGITAPGSMIPGKEIPSRPFLGLSDDDETEILNIIRDYVADAL